MRILFAGTPDVAIPSLDALVASDHEVVAVLTRPDARSGRGRTTHRSELGARADALGIPVLTPRGLRDDAVLDELRALDLDACAVVAYGGLIPPAALAIPRHGWINLHFSLLPRWRGAAPVQHAIAAGDPVTGVTTFLIEEGLDTGPTYRLVESPLGATETSGDVLTRLAVSGAPVLRETMDDLAAGRAIATPQRGEGVTKAPRISVGDAQVDFSRAAAEVDRLIRSVTPDPGAWCVVDGGRVKVGPVTVAADQVDSDAPLLAAGELRVTKRAVYVGTADHPVLLDNLQPQGKKMMAAADYARGARLASGTLVRRTDDEDRS
ncbi:methionyl-tRNA formyltransferase [Antricoccus suffuscus]|uniref:Methionyl-tRNA formyltransferase n=1 Tax=Antricoccus suffuscus TaxID=1629062 RepID=A0A2T0ZWC7_9ACTN|nr:methionyl-tRNA formyltransferase [Antricoccus suffuscus]PRZ40659.1 methionyl-tRNA formyltransferase [Antricoccus suffuscus]